MADQDLARALGRLEQAIETHGEELGKIATRSERVEEQMMRLARIAGPIKADIAALHLEATAQGKRIDDHGVRLAALEAPVKAAAEETQARRSRMRKRIVQLGKIIGVAAAFFEWVAKPIVSHIAEAWWNGTPPLGH